MGARKWSEEVGASWSDLSLLEKRGQALCERESGSKKVEPVSSYNPITCYGREATDSNLLSSTGGQHQCSDQAQHHFFCFVQLLV